MLIDNEGIDRMFEAAGITRDDFHNYFYSKYPKNDLFERKDIEILIERIKEWKNDKKKA